MKLIPLNCGDSCRVLAVLLIALLMTAAGAFAQAGPLRIIPLGDSITRGNNDIGFPNGDIPGGYRKQLENRLKIAGVAFDFVGSRTDNAALGMDPDHSGFPAVRTDEVLANLSSQLALAPDIVLLHLGSNDILQGVAVATALGNLDLLIDGMISNSPNLKLYVATIIPMTQAWNGRPAAQLNAEVNSYNIGVRNLVRQHANRGRKVFLVEMNSGITLTDPIPANNFFQPGDGIHPGQAGYKQMGRIWFDAIAASALVTPINGSFEFDFAGWTNTGNVAIGSGLSVGASDGTKSADFHPGGSTADGILSQSFATVAGATYDLAFDMGAAGNLSGQSLEVKIDGTTNLLRQTLAITNAGGGSNVWQPQALTFVADSTSATLSFTDLSVSVTGDGLLLDHLRITRRPSANGGSVWQPLRVHPQNPHILDFRGQPTLLRTYGEHYSSVINSNFDFVPYLNVLQRDGMNLTRAFLLGFHHDNASLNGTPLAPTPPQFMQPWKRSDAGGLALDGLGKWDLTAWNEEYFIRLKSFAQACSDRGIAIEFTFFCTFYNDSDWRGSPFNPANNVQGYGATERYDSMRATDADLVAAQEAAVRRISNELNGFDNIYYETQNEPFWNEPGVKDAAEVEFQKRMLGVIRGEEAGLPNRHLVAHNFPQFADALTPGFDMINEHYPLSVRVQGPDPAIAGAEVLLRDHYSRGLILSLDETHTMNALQTRLESWMFLLGGGAIYNGLDVPYFLYSAEDEAGDSALGRSFREVLRNLGSYVDNLHLAALRRDSSWITSGIPAGARVQSMASPGQQYVAYFHHGGETVPAAFGQLAYDPIDGSDHAIAAVVTLPAGSWRAVWVRPSDLVELRVREFVHGGGPITLDPVIYQQDVALRIDRMGSGDATPPPAPGGLGASSDSAGSIHLSWNSVRAADLAGYRVYRSEIALVPTDAGHLAATLPAGAVDFLDTSMVTGNTYHYVLTSFDLTGNESNASRPVTVISALDNLPHGGSPWPVPGTIQAEDFDDGGEGVAYHDLTPGNQGGLYRTTESVDVGSTTDAGGGHDVFNTQVGEWLEYTVNVETGGNHTLDLRVSNAAAGGQIRLEADGADISGLIAIPQTGSASIWQTITVPGISLGSGKHVLRLVVVAVEPNGTAGAINWLSLNPVITIGPTADAGVDLQVVDQDVNGSEQVTLDASGSRAGDAPILSYAWLKNGALIASGIHPVANLNVGNHLIQLKVTDTIGLESTDDVRVTVSPRGFQNGSFESGYDRWTATGNQHIQSGAPYAATQGSKLVEFNGGNLTPNGVLSQTFGTVTGATYTLAFDAGVLSYNTSSQKMQVSVTGAGILLSQSITINGLGGGANRWLPQSFTFVADSTSTTLTFRDQSASTVNLDLVLDNVRLTGLSPAIPNTPPQAVSDSFSTNENIPLVVAAAGVLANDTDVDFTPLTALLVAPPNHGTVMLNSNGSFVYTPNADFFGTDSFTYRARDGIADSNVATVTITVIPVVYPPLARADGFSTNENTALVVPAAGVLANDTDPRLRPLTAIRDSNPSHGSLVFNSNGGFTYTPAGDYFGPDSFSYHATNGLLNSNIVMVNLTVNEVIPAPVAAADSYSTSESIALVIPASGVLQNDSDPRSRPLTAVLGAGPAHGSIVLNANGSFNYIPNNKFFGIDSFTYRANNGALDSLPVTVLLTVTEVIPPPVAVPNSYVTNQNTSLVVHATGVLANDSDPRSRPITASLDAGPVHGILVLNTDGSFVYTPGADYFGPDSFTYHANNGVLDSNTVTVNLTVKEVIPEPVAIEDSYSTNEGVELVVPASGVLGNDTDPDSKPLTAVQDVPSAHGTLSLEPDGSFTYTPNTNFYGTDRFSYHANNGRADSAVVIVTLTVNEVIPAPLARDDGYLADEDTLLIVPAAGVLANDADPRSRPLTAVLDSGPAHGVLLLNADGSFVYTPEAGYFGPDSFTYHVGNGVLNSNTVTVDLTVKEFIPAPVALPDSYSTNEGVGLVILATGGVLANDADPDSRPLTAVLDTSPGHGTLSLELDGSFIYTPNTNFYGTDSFTYHASNGGADSSGVTVAIAVVEVIPAPLAVADSYSTNESTALVFPSAGVLVNDSDSRARPLSAVLDVSPNHGSLGLNANGSLTYIPNGGYFGSDSFDYHANNGTRDSNRVTVNLTITEVVPAPVVLADSYGTNEGEVLVVSVTGVLANDTDPRSRQLTAVLNAGPAHGTLGLNTNGSFSYTPNIGFYGTDSFTYRANNGVVNSTSATVTIAVREIVPPPAALADSYETNENTALVVPASGVLANDVDPRSRPLTSVLDVGPLHGILVLNADGSFTYTPAGSYSGTDSFTYHAGNGFLASNVVNVNLTVKKAAPAGLVNGSFESGFTGWTVTGNVDIQSALPYAATEGSKLVGFNGVNRTPNAVLSQSFGTIAGTTYTLAFDAGVLSYNTASQTMLVTVTGASSLLNRTITMNGTGGGNNLWLPQNFTFVANSATTVLSFRDQSTSTANLDMLLDNVRITAQPAVPNTAPVAVADTYATSVNIALVIPAAGVLSNDTDAQSTALIAALDSIPSHGSLTLIADGGFTYTPVADYTGTDSFTYHANDGALNSNIATVNITVNAIVAGGLANGSFEAGFAGWTTTGNQLIESAAPYAATDGTKLVGFNGGNQTPNAVLSQTFATTAGQTYALAFDAGVLSFNTNPQTLQVTVTGAGNLLTRTITINGASNGLNRWLPQSFTFVANSTTAVLTFRDQSTSTAGLDLLLDNVRISQQASPPNTAPVAVADSYATSKGTALAIPAAGVLANDTDAQSSPLTAALDAGPSHGTVSLNADGGFTYTPAIGYTGPDSFTYHANDGGLNSNVVTVNITVLEIVSGTLVNGSFEAGFSGWTTTGNLSIQFGTPYAATDGTKLAGFNGGNQAPNAVLSQSFTTTPGVTYILAFDAGVLSYNTNSQTLQVTVAGTGNLLTRTIAVIGAGNGINRWLPQSFSFMANSATTVLTFRDQSTTTAGIDLLLDNVRINGSAPSAIPQAITMMLETPAALPVIPPPTEIGIPTLSGHPGAWTVRLDPAMAGDYVLERSEDLIRWEVVTEKKWNEPGPLEFNDSWNPPSGRQFYRIGLRSK
ncbi:MAG: Ig-like domain-containing protein [Luteolibacter sp.]|uniref:Ig-like domain-containing protein n=1 Tax=Luteolibacter sp. TaxID=1962973 RepID=UPI00326780D5